MAQNELNKVKILLRRDYIDKIYEMLKIAPESATFLNNIKFYEAMMLYKALKALNI